MRSFGIELETISPSAANPLQHAVDTLATINVSSHQASYSSRDYRSGWMAKPDGSIGSRGAEIVSPVMPGNEASIIECGRVATALDAAGYTVNRSCGFHVHVSLTDLSATEKMLVALRFHEIGDELDKIVPASRRNGANHYCRRFESHEIVSLRQAASHGQVWINQNRYRVCNLAYIAHRGRETIEIRQFSGTVNAEKVMNTIRMVQEIIDEVVRRARSTPIATTTTVANSTMPRLNYGSAAYKIVNALTTTGRIDHAWREANGIGAKAYYGAVFNLRRAGARIENGPGNGEYTTASMTPVSREQLFTATATAVPVATTTPADLVRYHFIDGMSDTVKAWVAQRKSTFAEDFV